MKPSDTDTTTIPVNARLDSFRYSFYRSIESAGTDWDIAAPPGDLFLQRKYLSILENNPPLGMRFGYLIFYKNDQPAGVAICQIKYFKADDNINDLDMPPAKKEPCFFDVLASWVKKWIAGKVAADILISGNMLLTGEHGYWFDYHKISKEKALDLLEEALVQVIGQMEREGVKMPVILVKDIAPGMRQQHGRALAKKGFTEFEIQPNMILELPYQRFEDYIGAMSTKYRTRAKRAFKKLTAIEKKEMSLLDMQREISRMYALYGEIARNAGFNMVDLNEFYLQALKRDFGDYFRCFAYYRGDQLVAFYSTILNGDKLEAHFLGYEKALNHDWQLYLNILYDIVKIGIDSGCREIIFARTALEIKSSIGAEPRDLYCYLRQPNPRANKFAGTMLD